MSTDIDRRQILRQAQASQADRTAIRVVVVTRCLALILLIELLIIWLV